MPDTLAAVPVASIFDEYLAENLKVLPRSLVWVQLVNQAHPVYGYCSKRTLS